METTEPIWHIIYVRFGNPDFVKFAESMELKATR